MLRFDHNPSRRPRNFLLRREQTRLLVLVATLALVVVAMQQVRGPEAKRVIGQVFGFEPEKVAAETGQGSAQPGTPPPVVEADAQNPADALDTSRFDAVRDNTFFRNDETDAWFYTLESLQQSGTPATASRVNYAQLASQPEVYRGQAVILEGWARRVRAVKPAANTLGIDRLYRVTIEPAGGEVWPLTVYALDTSGLLDGEAELADDIRLPIRATGYFFKNESYRWQNGLGITPVVLASSLLVQSPSAESTSVAERPQADGTTILVSAAAISAVAIGFFVLRTRAAGPTRSTPASGPIDIRIPKVTEVGPTGAANGGEA